MMGRWKIRRSTVGLPLNVAAGCIIGIVVFFALGSLVPHAACRDGWNSPSIGRQGACSHHGGVEGHEVLNVFVFGLSVAAGVFTSSLLSRNDKSRPSRTQFYDQRFSVEAKLIMSAIENHKRIEFLYKNRATQP